MKLSTKYLSHLSVAVAVLAFGGFGIYLLQQSRAAELTAQPVVLSLAPTEVTVAKGEVINIAVKATKVAGEAGVVRGVVDYSADSLKLEAVRQACPAPGYADPTTDTTVSGTVTISCQTGAAANQSTLAVLVFRALTDKGSVPLKVRDPSQVSSEAAKQAAGGQAPKAAANITLDTVASAKQGAKTPRVVPNYKSRRLCADPKPGYVACKALRAINVDGTEITPDSTTSGYGPKEWHAAYQLPCTPGGPVQAVCPTPATYGPNTVAITIAGNYKNGLSGLESDLNAISQKYGIPPCDHSNGCLQVLNQKGEPSPLPADAGWGDELIMDLTAVHEVCQTCKIIVVEANDASIPNMSTAVDTAAKRNPVAVTNSWGGPMSASMITSSRKFFEHPGVAIIASTGDDLTDSPTASAWPSGLNIVAAAAGTKLQVNSDGTRASETVWSESDQGTGGGCAVFEKPPAEQSALANWGTAGCADKRSQGDVSLDADPATGIATIFNGQARASSGGTSLSAPLLAGIFGLSTNPLGTDQTAVNVIYKNYVDHPEGYHDVTSGSNCTSTVKTHCTAGAGFDTPSGLGAPVGISLTTGRPAPPPPTPLLGDINADGKVNITDLSLLLNSWGTNDTKADLNANGKVDISDLSTLLRNWSV